jgi:PD-(D/E)XK endonuclease
VDLTTDQKGSLAEAKIICAAIELGIGPYKPVTDGERYDLIMDLDPRLMSVQCNWARRQGDVIVVRCYSTRRTASGLSRRVYTTEEIDAVAAYCPDLDQCYFLPAEAFPGRTEIQLRVAPTKNNQRLLINWAKDCEFAATLERLGAIAQLGERLHGMQEVAGSSPAGSTPRRR